MIENLTRGEQWLAGEVIGLTARTADLEEVVDGVIELVTRVSRNQTNCVFNCDTCVAELREHVDEVVRPILEKQGRAIEVQINAFEEVVREVIREIVQEEREKELDRSSSWFKTIRGWFSVFHHIAIQGLRRIRL